ncbi:MAG: hypothetical protein AUJ70_01885 [Candidatus Omnitrophica bacterium CG1_02_40_15]|nr:MAG: hypothetical protein AUJ70_01885 [Candidatus Omnitrophica bacterium CG1_02_40_15]
MPFHILFTVQNMAKPIEAGIELEGDEAVRFVKRMLKEEAEPNPKRVKFIREALAEARQFKVEY